MPTPTIQQRLTDVATIANAIHNFNFTNLIALTKAFEIFQISTHNTHKISHQDPNEMKELFLAAQMSLQCLQDCILIRLGFTTNDIDVDELDKQYSTLHFEPLQFGLGNIALRRFIKLIDFYTDILKAQGSLSDLPQVQQAIRTTLGEPVRFYQRFAGSWTNMPVLRDIDLQYPGQRRVWNQIMLNFAAAVLLMMAKSVGDKFGGCIVELLGTKIPATGFAFE